MTKKSAARIGLIASLALLTALSAAGAVGQPPQTVTSYLDLVARYRGGEDTTPALEALSLEDIQSVVRALVSDPDSCPGTLCREAGVLMHTDAALSLLGRGRVAEANSQLQVARWLLGLDLRFHNPSSGSREAVEARKILRHAWLLAMGRLLMSHNPSMALRYFEDCRELSPSGTDSLLAAGSAQELMGSVDGLVPRPAPPPGFPPDSSAPWSEGHRRHAMQRALRAAERLYREAIELEPGFAEAHLRLGRVLQRRGRAEPARAQLSWVVENSTDDPLVAIAHLFLGELEKGHGQLDEAIKRFRLALWSEPDSQAAWVALSQALHRSGERTASAEAARVVLVREESGDGWLAYHLAFPERARAVMDRLRGEVRR